MNTVLIVLGSFNHFSLNAQDFEWGIQSSANQLIQPKDMAAFSNGDVVVVGACWGSTDVNPGLGSQILSSNGLADIFIARYSAQGELIWAFNVGGSDNDMAYAVDVDENGNIYVSGDYRSSFDIDPGSASTFLPAPLWTYARNIFMAKFSPSGNLIWANHFGQGTGACFSYDIACRNGRVLLTGSFQGNVDFDPGSSQVILSGSTNSSGYYCLYQSNGSLIWANSLENSNQSYVYGGWIDSDNHVFICGAFSNTMDLNPGSGINNLQSSFSNTYDAFIAKYSPTGALDFGFKIQNSTANPDFARSITGDTNGNIYVCGDFYGSCDFNPGSGQAIRTSQGQSDFFIAKYTNTGSFAWARRLGGSSYDFGQNIVSAADGTIYSVGNISGNVDLDPTSGIFSSGNNSISDVAIISLYSNGDFNWGARLKSNDEVYAESIALSHEDTLKVVGYLYDTLDVDPSSSISFDLSRSNPNALADMFISSYSPCEMPYLDSILVLDSVYCKGDSVLLSAGQGDLNDALYWRWSINGCTNQEIDSGETVSFVLDQSSNTFSVRGVGDCVFDAECRSVTLLAFDKPQVEAGEDTSVCEGEFVMLEATGALVYDWTNGYANGDSHLVSAGLDTITVVGTDSNGCSSADTIIIEGFSMPSVVIQKIGDSLIVDSTYQSYQWFLNDSLLNDETSNYLVISEFGSYSVLVSDSNMCTNEDVWSNLGYEEINKHKLRVFPNPNNGLFSLRTDMEVVGDLRIIHSSGQIIYETSYNSRSKTLFNLDLKTGFYLIHIQSGDVTYISKIAVY